MAAHGLQDIVVHIVDLLRYSLRAEQEQVHTFRNYFIPLPKTDVTQVHQTLPWVRDRLTGLV